MRQGKQKAIMNLLVVFSMILLQWSLDLADPRTQERIQNLFYGIHAVLLFFLLIIVIECYRRNDKQDVFYEDEFSKEKITQSARSYDVGSWSEMVFLKILLPGAVGLYMGKKTGIYFPLMLQCWSNPKMVYQSELTSIYLFREKAVGVLERPWKTNRVLPEWMSNLWDQAGNVVDGKDKGGSSSMSKKTKKKK